MQQFPLALTFLLNLLLKHYYFSQTICGTVLFGFGLMTSGYWWFKYGEHNFDSYKPSGAHQVGYADFKHESLECTALYPTDGKSGSINVPYLTYGLCNIEGSVKFVSFILSSSVVGFVLKFVLMTMK